MPGSDDSYETLRFPSPTLELGLTYAGWFGVHLGIDAMRRASESVRLEPYGGVRFGRWLAPVATLTLGLLAAATFSYP